MTSFDNRSFQRGTVGGGEGGVDGYGAGVVRAD
jgi:hypothetical protein